MMADADPRAPWHEPAMPVLDEEASWVHEAAERFEDAPAEALLEWALKSFHPKLAISAAGGVGCWTLLSDAGDATAGVLQWAPLAYSALVAVGVLALFAPGVSAWLHRRR